MLVAWVWGWVNDANTPPHTHLCLHSSGERQTISKEEGQGQPLRGGDMGAEVQRGRKSEQHLELSG